MDAAVPGRWQRIRRPVAAVLLAGALGAGPLDAGSAASASGAGSAAANASGAGSAAHAFGMRGSTMGDDGAQQGRLGVAQGVRLSGAAPVSRTIPLARGAVGAHPLVLEIGDITFPAPPSVAYEVYVNLPPGAAPDPHGAHHVGSLTFYGLDGRHAPAGPHARGQVYDITNVARMKGFDRGSVTVTFVPFDLVATPAGAPAAARIANVTIGRIEVRTAP